MNAKRLNEIRTYCREQALIAYKANITPKNYYNREMAYRQPDILHLICAELQLLYAIYQVEACFDWNKG